MNSLRLENVTYRYKSATKPALNQVSCLFEGGKLCAVVGPSGSGKTTLLSIMAGLDTPQSGSVFVNDKDIAGMDLDQYRRQEVTVIFQAFQLFPLLSALENVCYPMGLNGVPKAEAEKRAVGLMDSFGISEEMRKRYPSHLSGGEQQRVAIARALSSGARVLLADEPTGNLDVANGENIISILRRLAHEEGYCVVVVTHNPEIAEGSDVVYKMSDGILTLETA